MCKVWGDRWRLYSTWAQVCMSAAADLSHLLNLLLAAPDVAVGDVRFLLHSHHGHAGVDLGGERDLDLVLVAIHAAAQPQSESVLSTWLCLLPAGKLPPKQSLTFCEIFH